MLGPSVHETLSAPSKSGVSVPPSPVELLYSRPTGLQSFWDSSSQCQTLRLGSLMWGSGLSLLWENLCDIFIFQFGGHSPGRNGIRLCHNSAPPAVLLWLLFTECEIPVLVGSSLLYQWLFSGRDFGVFARVGELKAFYSALFSGIEWWLLVWMLAASLLSVCWLLSTRYGCAGIVALPGIAGLISTWCLVAGLTWVAAVRTLLGQRGQGLVPARDFPDI